MKHALLLATLLGVSCESPLDVYNKRPATTAEMARGVTTYAEAEECLGLHGRVRVVEWWVADRLMLDGKEIGGVQPGNDVIVSVRGAPLTYIWRHEGVHHVLRIAKGDPDAGHTNPLWSICPNDIRVLPTARLDID